MKSRTPQIIVNILTLIFALILNALATTLPLNGRTTAEISDSFNALFTPAGYVFSIWGLIYLCLIGFTVFQALPSQQANPRVAATGWWVALGNLANGIWIVFWHYGFYALTVVVMLALLLSLIMIYVRINRPGLSPSSPTTRWLVQFPFSVYLGWISVATIANISALLLSLGWDGWGQPALWTVLMIAVAAILSLLMRDAAYAGVIVWAVIGIMVKQASVLPIVIACIVAVGVCLGGLTVTSLRKPAFGKNGGSA